VSKLTEILLIDFALMICKEALNLKMLLYKPFYVISVILTYARLSTVTSL